MGRIEEKVAELAGKVAGSMGYEVEWVELAGSGRRQTLRVFIDKEGGVNIRDCELMSRELEALLDVEDLIKSPFNLEVSSPGLDRPLRRPEDFRKHAGKLARVITREPVDIGGRGGQTFFVGRIREATDDRVLLLVDEREIDIPYALISKARLEVEL